LVHLDPAGRNARDQVANLLRRPEVGVDEISYRRGHRYLTIVADHHSGHVVWVGKDRTKTSFGGFFDALGPAWAAQMEAISLDGSSIYLPVARERIPQATICLDPFHVIRWTNEVVDLVYRAERPRLPPTAGLPNLRDWRRTRHALRAGAEHLDDAHRSLLNALRRRKPPAGRCDTTVTRGWTT
jgi:transposase